MKNWYSSDTKGSAICFLEAACKSIRVTLLVLVIFLLSSSHAAHYPIQLSIPSCKVVHEIPSKDRDFAFINPFESKSYVYDSEELYNRDYQRAYFGVNCRKAGWDCFRIYEMLANGCIPYFVDINDCPSCTMPFLPRDLIKEAMSLEGVCYETLSIDHRVFDHKRYNEILGKLLQHTRDYLTTEKMAEYILREVNYTGRKPILFLSLRPSADHIRCLSLIGLKQLIQDKVVDFPKIEHIYTSYLGNAKRLYGKGFNYTRIVPDYPVDRSNIEEMIKNQEFELVIYGSLHRGLLFHDLVRAYYPSHRIFYICGEDEHECVTIDSSINLFVREFYCRRTLQ